MLHLLSPRRRLKLCANPSGHIQMRPDAVVFQNSAFNRIFGEVQCVMVSAASLCCTCEPFRRYLNVDDFACRPWSLRGPAATTQKRVDLWAANLCPRTLLLVDSGCEELCEESRVRRACRQAPEIWEIGEVLSLEPGSLWPLRSRPTSSCTLQQIGLCFFRF